jgi:hypothetical protein
MALRIIFKISNTALVFSRSFFIFSGIVSALFLPLGKPMAKRRNRVMFSGPYPLAGMAGTLPAVPVWIGATLVLVATLGVVLGRLHQVSGCSICCWRRSR